MHIAVCDDNIADRKQTERLLGRESDRRIGTTGNLYVDSYGSADSLLANPMVYDLFFIDMTAEEPRGMELAELLRKLGVEAPITLCVSSVDYRKYSSRPDNIYFIDKPIKVADLSEIIDKAIQDKKNCKSSIEIRGEKETNYVDPDEIILCKEREHEVEIVLKGGKRVYLMGDFHDMCLHMQGRKGFVIAGKCIVNLNKVIGLKNKELILEEGNSVTVRLSEKFKLKKYLSDMDIRI